jgi:hypothetical protein
MLPAEIFHYTTAVVHGKSPQILLRFSPAAPQTGPDRRLACFPEDSDHAK